MRIALIHDFLVEFGGAEKVLLDLLKLYPKADLYTLFYDQKKLGEFFDKYDPKTSFLQKFPKFLRGAYLRPLSPMAIESFNLNSYDLIISNCNSFAKGVITPPKTIHICYCHSPTRYLWDYSHRYCREHRLTGIKGAIAKPLLSYLRLWDREAAGRVDFFLANSENVAQRIKKFYRASSQVVYPGVDTKKFKINKKSDYFIIISRLSKYKKIDLAIKAFNRLNDRLLIIGAGPERRRLETMSRKNIQFLGFKPDQVVRSYYSRARALIHPQEEDFGLTPIEAMASGTPVIAYHRGGALESIKENKTGLFFKKQTAEDLVKAIERFKRTEKRFDQRKIKEYSQRFSTDRFNKEFSIKVKELCNKYVKKRKY